MTAQSNLSSFRAETPLPLNEALARFPMLAATRPAPNVSDRYAMFETRAVLERLTSEGFAIHGVQATRGEFGRHLVTLRHETIKAPEVGALVPEIALLNSHDGSTAYQLFAGVTRIICLNGLMVGTAFATYRVAHVGRRTAERVAGAAFDVAADFPRVIDEIRAMQSRQLARSEHEEFLQTAHRLRFGDPENAPITPRQLDATRRTDDEGRGLWEVFNRVQENVMRGGARGLVRSDNRFRRTTVRPINGVQKSVSLNRALWDAAAAYIDRTPRPLTPLEYAA